MDNMINQETLGHKYLKEVVGISIEIISNEYNEFQGNEHHKIAFQINEEEPDLFAFSILFFLSLLSFAYAAPGDIQKTNLYQMKNGILNIFLKGWNLKVVV